MATGDQNDFVSRIRALIPPNWFPNPTVPAPIITGLITAYANMAAFIYSLIAYARLQTRIKTASGGWLDLIAYDFFGLALQRAPGQSDASFAASIIAQIFRPRNTRASIVSVLTQLTGLAPDIFEPNWSDGSYLNSSAYYGVTPYCSRGAPYQLFVTAHVGSSGITAAQVYAAINSVRSAGITVWTKVTT